MHGLLVLIGRDELVIIHYKNVFKIEVVKDTHGEKFPNYTHCRPIGFHNTPVNTLSSL